MVLVGITSTQYEYIDRVDARDPCLKRLLILLYKLGMLSAGRNLPIGFHE